MLTPRTPALPTALALALTGSFALGSCKRSSGYKGRAKTPARKWIDSPTRGTKDDKFLKIPSLGVTLEIPETRYVFKNCHEPPHTPGEPNGWIPVISCSSSGSDVPASAEDEWEAGGDEDDFTEDVAMTFYITPKERPIDERAVAYFKNTYKSEGYDVQDLSFNDDYHEKTGIYALLRVMDEEGINPVTEIVQFMFPYDDVLFIVRMEYPFADGRTSSMSRDWQAIMWYFKFEMPGAGGGKG